MLADVRADPLWYAGILLKRLAATVTQWKLRSWGPWSGHPVAPRGHPSEGVIDAYYALTTTVDFVGAGPFRLELPLPVLVLPTWGLVFLAWRRKGLPASGRGGRSWSCCALPWRRCPCRS